MNSQSIDKEIINYEQSQLIEGNEQNDDCEQIQKSSQILMKQQDSQTEFVVINESYSNFNLNDSNGRSNINNDLNENSSYHWMEISKEELSQKIDVNKSQTMQYSKAYLLAMNALQEKVKSLESEILFLKDEFQDEKLLKQVKRNEALNEEKNKQRNVFEKFEKNLKEKLIMVQNERNSLKEELIKVQDENINLSNKIIKQKILKEDWNKQCEKDKDFIRGQLNQSREETNLCKIQIEKLQYALNHSLDEIQKKDQYISKLKLDINEFEFSKREINMKLDFEKSQIQHLNQEKQLLIQVQQEQFNMSKLEFENIIEQFKQKLIKYEENKQQQQTKLDQKDEQIGLLKKKLEVENQNQINYENQLQKLQEQNKSYQNKLILSKKQNKQLQNVLVKKSLFQDSKQKGAKNNILQDIDDLVQNDSDNDSQKSQDNYENFKHSKKLINMFDQRNQSKII